MFDAFCSVPGDLRHAVAAGETLKQLHPVDSQTVDRPCVSLSQCPTDQRELEKRAPIVAVPARTETTRQQGSKRVRAGRTQSDLIIPYTHKATERRFLVIKNSSRLSRRSHCLRWLSIRARTYACVNPWYVLRHEALRRQARRQARR